MTRTHAYLSALVPFYASGFDSLGNLSVTVKAQTFSAEANGFIGKPYVEEMSFLQRSVDKMIRQRVQFFEKGTERAEDVEWVTAFDWAMRAAYCCLLHGDSYPTWIGDMYLQPVFVQSGKSGKRRLSHYLVTEAPDLDSGLWEGDQLPLRG